MLLVIKKWKSDRQKDKPLGNLCFIGPCHHYDDKSSKKYELEKVKTIGLFLKK